MMNKISPRHWSGSAHGIGQDQPTSGQDQPTSGQDQPTGTKSCMHSLQNIYHNFSRELLGVIRSLSYHLQHIVWKNSVIWSDLHMRLSISHISTMKRRNFICVVMLKNSLLLWKKTQELIYDVVLTNKCVLKFTVCLFTANIYLVLMWHDVTTKHVCPVVTLAWLMPKFFISMIWFNLLTNQISDCIFALSLQIKTIQLYANQPHYMQGSKVCHEQMSVLRFHC